MTTHSIANGLKALILTICALATVAPTVDAQKVETVKVVTDASVKPGLKLQVDGRDFMVFGMNWGYMPIGENYMYSLWSQPDEFIEEVLAREMPLLNAMGVNVIRQYVGIPPKWVKYIYEKYGIYTVVNHPVARYGYTLDGVWIPAVDYSDEKLRSALVAEITDLVGQFDGTPGMLMWLLGNENNYGLSWSSFEIEALPEGERDAARARYLYSLFEEITLAIKQLDTKRPVAIANGDLQYIDIIAEECQNLDVLGSNVYRGISARDLFQVVSDKLGVPVMFTEFGADAWNAREMREDQITQAKYLVGQWQEIYEQSAGKGRVGNAIGGFIFQWSDGWWKFGQDSNLEVHDINASWPNAGYPEDYVEGDNNMNEEWWGITSKGPRDHNGYYDVYPRAAYYALLQAFRLDPYDTATDLDTIRAHFATVSPVMASVQARADDTRRMSESLQRVRVSGMRMEFETYSTGGNTISTPPAESPQTSLPFYLGFSHQQSFYVDFQVNPAGNIAGNLSMNVLGNVGVSQIDEIYYENRGRQQTFLIEDESGIVKPVDLQGLERVRVYGADITWDDRWFRLNGFYRRGHTHWGYEGDFFGIYRDAYYGDNTDIYNAIAPLGVEIAGKKYFNGLKAALGSELWWGANPQYLLKYNRSTKGIDWTAMYQDEFARQSTIYSSIAVPLPPTRRATLSAKKGWGPFGFEVGGIWAGSTKEGETFNVAEENPDGSYRILEDRVKASDTWGGKARVTMETGRWHWYAQGSYAGIVADGGATAITTFTGWKLKDPNYGNQQCVVTGLAVNMGNFQIGPNFLWQKPVVDPLPNDMPDGFVKRNVIRDPFAVRANRETIGGELLIAYDPTPASWMWAWDNDVREDARLAWSLGFTGRYLPTTMDAGIGILEDGRTPFAFPNATPPRDLLWEVNYRLVSRLDARRRIVAHAYVGNGEANGDDPRLIDRFGADARITWGTVAFETFARFNDWGPYDYHRDFNFTFPVHLMADVSYSLGAPRWFGFPQTRVGIRGLWRSLDQYSNRYCPGVDEFGECDPTIEASDGTEWEFRTYLHVSL
jgi:hypothetical protein